MSFFKRSKQIPQLKGSSPRKGSFFSRGRSLPRLSSYRSSYQSKISFGWLVIGGAVTLLALVMTMPYWISAVSFLIPDRYIMAYAPEAVQQAVFDIDVSEQVPSALVDEAAADDLLNNIVAPTATPLPTATLPPVSSGVSSESPQFLQPTAIPVDATPTLTPVFSYDVNSGAEDIDNEADLSHADVLLQGFTFTQQGYNNCGPASISTMMSYWGVEFTQTEAANYLKPDPEDPNVRPDEMTSFIESKGYKMTVRVNGDIELLKNFVRAGYPIMIETGYDPEPDTVGWTSHYLTIVGFSEVDQSLIAMDTYRRPNWSYPYEEINEYWRQFNHRYLIVYREDQSAAVASLLGEQLNDTVMYTDALHNAQFELSLDRNDPYAWFNLGSSLAGLGRHEEAATAFDKARDIGLPWRFLWYQFAPFETYLQVGRYEDVILLADSVLQKKSTEEPFYYKGLAYSLQGDEAAARRQFQQALRFNKNYTAAQLALDALGN